MRKQIHILNGDVLKGQFPKTIEGQLIICRECLVEGNIAGDSIEELFVNRAKFLNENYGGKEHEYQEKVASEFQNILKIENSDVNLWFEDDLFCQVNFWFVTHLLDTKSNGNAVYLVRPQKHTQYGFGGLNESELISIYEERLTLSELNEFSNLWRAYQINDTTKMFKIAQALEDKYSFITQAIEAHIQRIPTEGYLGRPIESLITIMDELKTDEFGLIFREFGKRENIYGFGDLQVKRLYDQIKTANTM